jgi:hypothetical protein
MDVSSQALRTGNLNASVSVDELRIAYSLAIEQLRNQNAKIHIAVPNYPRGDKQNHHQGLQRQSKKPPG